MDILSDAERDRQWSQGVRARDRHVCRFALPGCLREASEAHHIRGRMHRATRWVLANGLATCRNCHGWIEAHPAVGDFLCREVAGPRQAAELDRMVKGIGYENKKRQAGDV